MLTLTAFGTPGGGEEPLQERIKSAVAACCGPERGGEIGGGRKCDIDSARQ